MNLLQVNVQSGFGGGEVYTLFLGRALRDLGISFDLVVHPEATWWRDHDTGASRVLPVGRLADIVTLDFRRPAWLVFHSLARAPVLAALKEQGCRTACFAHMPLHLRSAEPFRPYDMIFAVSRYVLDGLRQAGLSQAHDEPLYGVAHLARHGAGGSILAASPYDWDRRKARDRLLSYVEPLAARLRPRRRFERRPGITLGVVSRLTPIKQFPLLFSLIAPILRDIPEISLEIFGAGGYASVRDTRRALAVLGSRVRWWGHQSDVATVYGQLDYLLTGLPEKEALGLNVIEAQTCGVPVLAPDAPPFVETVVAERTGYLYPDPRIDAGTGLRALLRGIASGMLRRPDPRLATAHLARFSESAFRERVRGMVDAMARAVQSAGAPNPSR